MIRIMCNRCPHKKDVQNYYHADNSFEVAIECEHSAICDRAYVEGLRINNKLLDTKIEDLILDSERRGLLGINRMLKRFEKMKCKTLGNVLEGVNREIDRYRTEISTMERMLWTLGLDKRLIHREGKTE